MWIHLVRHGIAIDREDPACPTDPERPLTDKGRTRTDAAARGLATIGVQPDRALASPYVRAVQTAEIVLPALGGVAGFEPVQALLPMADPEELVPVLRATAAESVVCFGHAPNLDRLAAFLCGADAPITSLKKAGVAALSVTQIGFGGASLYAVYPPSVLRRLPP